MNKKDLKIGDTIKVGSTSVKLTEKKFIELDGVKYYCLIGNSKKGRYSTDFIKL
jgi:hypothetical protein